MVLTLWRAIWQHQIHLKMHIYPPNQHSTDLCVYPVLAHIHQETHLQLHLLQHGLFFLFFIFAVRRPLTVVASPVAEHRLRTRRPSGHGSRAQPLRGMWDPPRPGHEPVSPASAGGLSTTAPPGKPGTSSFCRTGSQWYPG